MDTYEALMQIRAKIQEWRDSDVFEGDRNFQDMLERESELSAEYNAEVNQYITNMNSWALSDGREKINA